MTHDWEYVTTVVDGNRFEIAGLNIWDNKWIDTGESIHIKDPLYGQEYSFPVYEIISGEKKVRFATGEFSNCIWGIYLQKTKLEKPNNRLSISNWIQGLYKK
jgi:hypothetical protein